MEQNNTKQKACSWLHSNLPRHKSLRSKIWDFNINVHIIYSPSCHAKPLQFFLWNSREDVMPQWFCVFGYTKYCSCVLLNSLKICLTVWFVNDEIIIIVMCSFKHQFAQLLHSILKEAHSLSIYLFNISFELEAFSWQGFWYSHPYK